MLSFSALSCSILLLVGGTLLQSNTGKSYASTIAKRSPNTNRAAIQGITRLNALLIIDAFGRETFCSGTLVHPEWVITAASCVTNISSVVVLFGLQNTMMIPTDPDQFTRVVNITIHPCSNENIVTGTQLAMLKLASPQYNFPQALLPVSYEEDWRRLSRFGGILTNCISFGYGETRRGTGSELEGINISRLSLAQCRSLNGYSNLQLNRLCPVAEVASSNCQISLGAALLCRRISDRRNSWYLAGVNLATQENCRDSLHSAIFMPLYNSVHWILAVVENHLARNAIYGCPSILTIKHD